MKEAWLTGLESFMRLYLILTLSWRRGSSIILETEETGIWARCLSIAELFRKVIIKYTGNSDAGEPARSSSWVPMVMAFPGSAIWGFYMGVAWTWPWRQCLLSSTFTLQSRLYFWALDQWPLAAALTWGEMSVEAVAHWRDAAVLMSGRDTGDVQRSGLDNESLSVASRGRVSSLNHFLSDFPTRRSRLWCEVCGARGSSGRQLKSQCIVHKHISRLRQFSFFLFLCCLAYLNITTSV